MRWQPANYRKTIPEPNDLAYDVVGSDRFARLNFQTAAQVVRFLAFARQR